jgi:hypothetical protein
MQPAHISKRQIGACLDILLDTCCVPGRAESVRRVPAGDIPPAPLCHAVQACVRPRVATRTGPSRTTFMHASYCGARPRPPVRRNGRRDEASLATLASTGERRRIRAEALPCVRNRTRGRLLHDRVETSVRCCP